MSLGCVGLALLFAGPAAAYQPACDGRLPLLRRAPLVASSSAVAAPQSRASDRQLYLLFGSRFVQSIMRLAMGPLVVYVCGDMACDASSRGQLLSSYSLGYLSSQIAGGALADRIGPRLVILCASALGGACTLASASARSVRALCLAQVLLGVSQGPLYPTSIAYLGAVGARCKHRRGAQVRVSHGGGPTRTHTRAHCRRGCRTRRARDTLTPWTLSGLGPLRLWASSPLSPGRCLSPPFWLSCPQHAVALALFSTARRGCLSSHTLTQSLKLARPGAASEQARARVHRPRPRHHPRHTTRPPLLWRHRRRGRLARTHTPHPATTATLASAAVAAATQPAATLAAAALTAARLATALAAAALALAAASQPATAVA